MGESIYIAELGVDNFKSFRVPQQISKLDLTQDLSRGINCIIGENGQGKSNLIESILFSMGAKDERTVRNSEFVHRGGEFGNRAKSWIKVLGCEAPQGQNKLNKPRSSSQDASRSGVLLKAEVRYPSNNQVKVGNDPIKKYMNNKVVTGKTVAKFFQQYNINVKRPSFVISQGNVTKLASLSGKAVFEFINDRFGFSVQTEPAIVMTKMMAKIRENLNGMKDKKLKQMFESLFTQLEQLDLEAEIVRDNQQFKQLEKDYKIFDYYRKYYKEEENKDKERDYASKLFVREEELSDFKRNLRQGQMDEMRVEHDLEEEEREINKELKQIETRIDQQIKMCQIQQTTDADREAELNRELDEIEGLLKNKFKQRERKENELEEYERNLTKLNQKLEETEEQIQQFKVVQVQAGKGRISRDLIQEELDKKMNSREMAMNQLNQLKERKRQTEEVVQKRQADVGALEAELDQEEEQLNSFNDIDQARSQTLLSERDVVQKALIKKREELIHCEKELQGTESQMQGLHSLKVRAHPHLTRFKVFGFLHQLFKVAHEARPWLPALSIHLGFVLFNVVIKDGETAKIIGNNDKLLVNPPRGPLWFSQEDRMMVHQEPRQVINTIVDKFKGRVKYALDLIIPEERAKRSVKHVFAQLFLCEDQKEIVEVNDFAWKRFKLKIAVLSQSGSCMTEEGVLRYRTIDTRQPLTLCAAQKRIHLIQKREMIKKEYEDLQQEEKQSEFKATQVESRLRNRDLKYERVEKNKKRLEKLREDLETEEKRLARHKRDERDIVERLEELELELKQIKQEKKDKRGGSVQEQAQRLKVKINELEGKRQEIQQKIEENEEYLVNVKADLDNENREQEEDYEKERVEREIRQIEEKKRERSEQIRELQIEKRERLGANQEMKINLKQKQSRHLQNQDQYKKQEVQLKKLEDEADSWKYFLETRKFDKSGVAELRRIEKENPWITNEYYLISKEQAQNTEEDGRLEEIYKEQLDRRQKLMAHLNKNSLNETKFKTYQECEDEKEKVQRMLRDLYLNASSLAVWDVCGEFAANFAKLIERTERMQAVILLNKAILEVSKSIRSVVTVQVLLKDCHVFHNKREELQLIYAKDEELLFKHDRELSGGQKSMIALIITLAFQRVMRQPIILLDEVDAALDVYNSEIIAEGLREFVRITGMQVIAVSHRQHLPLEADRVFKIGKGEHHKKSKKISQVTAEEVKLTFAEIKRNDPNML